MRKPARIVVILTVASATLVAGGFAAFLWTFRGHWESTLCGPFHGTNYTQHPQGIEMSSLEVSEQLALKVVWVSELDAPVLSLVSSDGQPIWSRLLTLELPLADGSVRHGRIKTLTLKQILRAADGYKVMVACDWYWGGNERGIIRLGEDYSFRDISLGW